MRKTKSFKCPICNKIYGSLNAWSNHMVKIHPAEIPDEWSPERYFYFLQTGKAVGKCIVCHEETDWNQNTLKYDRFCSNPKCKEAYREQFKGRMIGKYGKVHLLNDPNKQREMQANKKISGEYEFEDGGKVAYVGSYELDFLKMCDKFLGLKSTDIMGPSVHTYYYKYTNPNDKEHEGVKFYIPDFYIVPYNLEVEIKQTTNKHPKILAIDKVKEKCKDALMKTIKNVNYIKLNEKDYSTFFEFLIRIKENTMFSKEDEEIIYYNKKVSSNPVALESMFSGENDIPAEIVTEGYVEDLISNIFSSDNDNRDDLLVKWEDKIMKGYDLIGGPPQKTKYLTLSRVIVDRKEKVISIQNININLLLNRIKETYKEKRLDLIFDRTYASGSIAAFYRKKMSRSQMKITSLVVPLFFALELTVLFKELYQQYYDPLYRHIYEAIYKMSWLAECDKKYMPELNTTNLDRFRPEYKLKDHQMEFIKMYPQLKAGLNLNGFILSFDQGMGKTLTAVALAECLNADKVYIICPNKAVDNVWKPEIISYISKYSNIKIAEEEVVTCREKITKEVYNKAKYIITNNENIKALLAVAEPSDHAMIIVDEMQNFRNKDGVRVKEMLELKNKIYCRDNLLMSGTPIKARPNEIVPAMLMIDPLFTDHAAEIYDKCFALDSVMAMSIIQQRFGKIIYRKTKAILDLPEKHNERLPLKISKPEKYYMVNIKREVMKVFDKIYADALKQNVSLRNEFISIVDRYSTSTVVEKNKYLNWIIKTVNTDRSMAMHELDKEFVETYIDKFLKQNIPANSGTLERLKWLEVNFLRMERSCMGKAIGQIYPKYRTEMFIALYEENKQTFYDMITKHPKKTIIFSQMLGVVNYIHNDLNKNGIGAVKVVGGMSDTPAVIDKFKGDNNTLVLVATSQTLNSAVTLNEASQMFFFGPPFRSTDMSQCEDRIHRIGQTSEVYIYNVILDTSSYNLSNRMETIVNWSNQMFSTAMQLDEIPALESVMLSCAPIEEYEGYILQYLICPELFEDKKK